VRRFEEIGIADARHLLDPYVQSGSLATWNRDASPRRLQARLSDPPASPLPGTVPIAWMGYMKEVPGAASMRW
jgi:hypothetical protein